MISNKLTQISNNERGAALLMTMVMLVILTLIGIAATKTSTFEIKFSGVEKNKKAAFYTAEAGIEHAKKLMDGETFDSGTETWDIEGLGDAVDRDSAVEYISETNLGGYAYTVKIWDSGRLHVLSESRALNNKSKSAIEVTYSSKSEEWLKEDGGYTAQAGHNEQKSFSDQLDDKEAMDKFEQQL